MAREPALTAAAAAVLDDTSMQAHACSNDVACMAVKMQPARVDPKAQATHHTLRVGGGGWRECCIGRGRSRQE